MLTPVFKIVQSEDHLCIEIHAPYANIEDADMDYEGNEFFFTAKPYFLKLFLPAELGNPENATSTYDCDQGKFTFKVPKKKSGEYFHNLDMICELLKPSKVCAKPFVEEIEDEFCEDVPFCGNFPSAACKLGDVSDDRCVKCGYGFAWSRCEVIGRLSFEVGKIIDIESPETVEISKRAELCKQYDKKHFNAEHYIADLFEENELLDEIMEFQLSEQTFELCFESRDRLKDLPKKTLPQHTANMQKSLILSLADILFSYLYDLRTTCGEHTVESGWTIVKLSPTLSFLLRYSTAKEALICAVRRSLCYPLYRNWKLSMKVVDDLKQLLSKGRTALLQCMVDARRILSTSGDFRYVLNDLYLTDYCLWIQQTSDDLIEWLRKEIDDVILEKRDIDLDLDDLELTARLQSLGINDNKSDEKDSDDD